jgi:hypothetical protein
MAYNPIKKGLRKRYIRKGKKGKKSFKYSKLARDVAYLRRALNTERKFATTDIQVNPTVTVPTLTRINTPDVQGTASVGERTGAKVRATHFSMKGRFTYLNYGDKQSNCTCVLYMIWLKNGEFQSDFESNFAEFILNKDQNNQFSPLAYFNKVKYDSWIATYKKKLTMSDLIPLNQTASGLASTPGGVNTLTTLGKAPQTKHYYCEVNKKINVPIEWNNTLSATGNTDEISRMVPYIFIITDSLGSSVPSGSSQPDSTLNDKVQFSATCRLTYVDN